MNSYKKRNIAMKFRLFIAASLIAFANPGFAQSDKQGVDMRVILLGTGGPEMSPNRFGYATLVEAGGQKLLFDAGRGVMQRIYESRVKVTSVTNVFTHLHNDHIEGLPSLWMTPWFLLGRTQPLQVWGASRNRENDRRHAIDVCFRHGTPCESVQ
ncbi:MBL fold metallo-hydrolase [Undibacterium arcticum]